MQEFTDAMAELDAAMDEQKRKIGEQFRPVFFQHFKKFFEENPEIAAFAFRVSSEGYDDEEHYDELTGFTYRLREDLDEGQENHDVEGGPLAGVSHTTRAYARGEDPDARYYPNSARWRTPEYLAQRRGEAEAELALYDALVAKIGESRVEDLNNAVIGARETLDQGENMDFYKVLFGLDVDVTITGDGITIGGEAEAAGDEGDED